MNGFAEKRRAAVDAAMREEVFKTSIRILAEEGLNALTLDHIAKEVGVSRPTLYNYFPDRAGVLIYIQGRVFSDFVERLDKIAASDRPAKDRLQCIARTIIESLSCEHALLLAFFHQELIEGSVLEAKAERREGAINMVTGIVEEGVEAGVFRLLPARLAAEMFFSIISGLVDRLVYNRDAESAIRDVPEMVDLLFTGFNA